MDYVVAILDQNTFRLYRNAAEAPEGSTIFSSSEELARAIPVQTMDRIRGRLLKEDVGLSTDAVEAARRLWEVFGMGADLRIRVAKKYTPATNVFGTRKIQDESRIELIKLGYRPKHTVCNSEEHMVWFFYEKLPKQAKQLVQVFVDDGSLIWTRERASALVEARKDEFVTKLGAQFLLKYYLSTFFAQKIMRRVTFAEFASKPEFEGFSLV